MKNSILLIIVCLCFLLVNGCKNDGTNPSQEYPFYEGETYFNGLTNGENWSGGGIAFIVGDSVLIIRGVYGGLNNYNEINIKVSNKGSNVTELDSGEAGKTFIAGDVIKIENEYTSRGQQSDIIIYNWNVTEGYVSGAFSFSAYNINSVVSLVSGEFKIQTAPSGTNWTKKYDKEGNLYCWFY